MRLLRVLLLCGLTAAGIARGAERNAFFAMNTIAKGPPDVVVPLLKELGYAGLGGAAGDRAMAEALKESGLRFFNGYVTLQFHAERTPLDDTLRAKIDAMAGHDTALWLAVAKIHRGNQALAAGAPGGEDIAAAHVKAIADYAWSRGIRVSLYPHTGHWFEHFEDAVRMAERLSHPGVGVTFNLCHWLKVEGSARDPEPLLKAALPRLTFVTINGADAGDTRTMAWNRLILPLGEGSYDVGAFLRTLRAVGYAGPVGFQGYGIKAPPREVLAKTMEAWKRLQPGEK